MQSKALRFQQTRQQAKRLMYTVWDGPGKFFIVIFISMFIVGIHESIKSIKQDQRIKTKFQMNSEDIFINKAKKNIDNKVELIDILKRKQNQVQIQKDDENMNWLLDMANEQMENERNRGIEDNSREKGKEEFIDRKIYDVNVNDDFYINM